MSYTIQQLRDYDRSDTDAMLDWTAAEIERLTAIADQQGELLKDCQKLLRQHHDVSYRPQWGEACGICGPAGIFNRLQAAEKARQSDDR